MTIDNGVRYQRDIIINGHLRKLHMSMTMEDAMTDCYNRAMTLCAALVTIDDASRLVISSMLHYNSITELEEAIEALMIVVQHDMAGDHL